MMRIAGSVLLLIGLILCASIDWAAVGFVTMGAGLLVFQAAESKQEAIKLQDVRSPIGPIGRPVGRISDREQSTSFDRERWRHLAEGDRDIAQAEAILARCGVKYAEQFARTYLIFENRALLSSILSTIVASYRLDSGLDGDVGAKTIANFSVGMQDSAALFDRSPAGLTPAPRPEPAIEETPTNASVVLTTREQDEAPDAVRIDHDADEPEAASPAENDSTENLRQLLEWLDRPAAQK
ncbi:DUF5362 domain-containing protein [Bradyrhizobium symbiodeficiens]|uniref:DUF5362 domain-containing protein n=1 Tax=Bradyrhizobium symbiodeficiens TaxID=1404367 RepID=UPI00140F5AF4|nr:DUF5362 domain-containing protein [Bradyrhizobium symbiodeficiens]QIO98870.1 DUF5362 domain-containing protein [Bradyrhizobium symbiodeficiens]